MMKFLQIALCAALDSYWISKYRLHNHCLISTTEWIFKHIESIRNMEI